MIITFTARNKPLEIGGCESLLTKLGCLWEGISIVGLISDNVILFVQ